MKIFTDDETWEKSWYRRLTPEQKLLWKWLCEHCDPAGVISPDWELASFQIGGKGVSLSDMEPLMEGRITKLDENKFHLTKYIEFQQGRLSLACVAHKRIFKALERHGISPDPYLITKNGSSKAPAPGFARPPDAYSIRKSIEILQDRIAEHPANRNGLNIDKPTEAEKKEFKELVLQRKNLENALVSTTAHRVEQHA